MAELNLDTSNNKEDELDSADMGSKSRNSKGMKLNEKDRKIGHRRIDQEGQVSYKKIYTNQLMASIQLGIQYSVGHVTGIEDRDLLMQDFMTVETYLFPKNGGAKTPAHCFSDFTFRSIAPVAFKYFLNLFGITKQNFLMSLCDLPLVELSNPGVSGSIFYLTSDDEFILKTVQRKESHFLQQLLAGYYMNLNQNPRTLLPKFFGLFCYQYNQKNIRLVVMNNLLPSKVPIHLKFDLKGSTWKRMADKNERAKSSPTYKDLDFMEILPEGLFLEPDTYNALITTLSRDSRVLESFKIMDYSLLVGIHNLDQAAKDSSELRSVGSNHNPSMPSAQRSAANPYPHLNKLAENILSSSSVIEADLRRPLIGHSSAMYSIQAEQETDGSEHNYPVGGIPARNHKGERLLLYLGIIDILQSYKLVKKIEHKAKAIFQDGKAVSVSEPHFYARRFLSFMADRVFKKNNSPLKHSPSKRGKKDFFRVQKAGSHGAQNYTEFSFTSSNDQPRVKCDSNAAVETSAGGTSACISPYEKKSIQTHLKSHRGRESIPPPDVIQGVQSSYIQKSGLKKHSDVQPVSLSGIHLEDKHGESSSSGLRPEDGSQLSDGKSTVDRSLSKHTFVCPEKTNLSNNITDSVLTKINANSIFVSNCGFYRETNI